MYIPRNKEFRIEVNESQKFKIKVVKGFAEHKGAELVPNKFYLFSDCKTSIFTFTGCEIVTEGDCDLSFVCEVSMYPKLYDFYSKEESYLILGDSISTVAITLSNYFIRDIGKINFIELDPSKGNIFPGTLSISKIDEISFNSFKINDPFSLFYGSKDMDNLELYEKQMIKLCEKVDKSESFVALAPFINQSLLDLTISHLKPSKVIVVHNERLFHKINKKHDNFVYLSNTGYQEENKVNKSINRYFNGEELVEVNDVMTLKSIYSKKTAITNLSVVKVGEDYVAPDTALPIGADRKVGIVEVEDVDLIENAVLAISDAQEREDVALSPVLGFVVCVDDKKGKVTSVQPKLPKATFLLQSNIFYSG